MRLDALEGSCRYWQDYLAKKQDEAIQKQRAAAHAEYMKDPLQKNRCVSITQVKRSTSMLSKRRR